MHPFLYRVSTQLKYQLPIAALGVAAIAACVFQPQLSGVDLSSLDRSTLITSIAAIASIIALFCSLSIAWILFISQQNKSERVTAYDLLKERLLEAQKWLFSQPNSEERELCLALVFELDKLDMSDIPQTDRGDEYREYANTLESGLDSKNDEQKLFYLTSIIYFGYIEHLLNRIGLISIRQVISRAFIETLAKGIFLVCFAVLILVTSTFWYGDATKPWLVLTTSFTGIGALLLLFEVWVDMRRNYEEELDFIESSPVSKNET